MKWNVESVGANLHQSAKLRSIAAEHVRPDVKAGNSTNGEEDISLRLSIQGSSAKLNA